MIEPTIAQTHPHGGSAHRTCAALAISLLSALSAPDQRALAAGSEAASAKDAAKSAITQSRTLVLASDDFIDASAQASGSGRLIWTEATNALQARGLDVVAGSAKSLARAGEEAHEKSCTLIAAPQITRLKGSKRELTAGVEVTWYDLQRTAIAHCSQQRRVTAPKGEEVDPAVALRQALDACLADVLGLDAGAPSETSAGLSLSPTSVIGATAALLYGKTPEDDPDPGLPRFQPRASTARELADALSSGRTVFIDRVYSRGDSLIARLEAYHKTFGALAAETAVDTSTVKSGFRLRERLADRAASALLATMRARGVAVPEPSRGAIPASDPLDTVIQDVAVTLPTLIDAPPAAAHTTTFWLRLTVDENGNVSDAQPMADSAPEVLEAARALKFKPGTRAGKPVTTRMIFAFRDVEAGKKDMGPG